MNMKVLFILLLSIIGLFVMIKAGSYVGIIAAIVVIILSLVAMKK